jgi:hypothetical protein
MAPVPGSWNRVLLFHIFLEFQAEILPALAAEGTCSSVPKTSAAEAGTMESACGTAEAVPAKPGSDLKAAESSFASNCITDIAECRRRSRLVAKARESLHISATQP